MSRLDFTYEGWRVENTASVASEHENMNMNTCFTVSGSTGSYIYIIQANSNLMPNIEITKMVNDKRMTNVFHIFKMINNWKTTLICVQCNQ